MSAFLPQVIRFRIRTSSDGTDVVIQCMDCDWDDIYYADGLGVPLGAIVDTATAHWDETHR